MNRQRVKALLDQAAQIPVAQRPAFVRQVAADDPAVAAEVFDLLHTLDDSAFMNAPTAAAPEAIAGLVTEVADATMEIGAAETIRPASRLERPGTRIGRYKLLQQIGEGGFGTVFMAEQTEPVVRRVALKIIKAGMDTRQVIARFEAERQALALMDHPNIARVLDAGATETGRPYFVMELVKGEPITKYCDRERLSVEQRLQLFADVCRAVQHAHQKGVIHRDLKPSNVLVTVADGQPLPKVIDFGIAKATAAPLTDKTLFTEMHQLIGTPEYMSPEQAEPAAADVDTRSDVYSLGVLLYELLTGTTPFDGVRLKSAGLQGLVRIIREEEPPRPSLRMQTLVISPNRLSPPASSGDTAGSSAFEIARCRRAEPQRLVRHLRGDLDWIIMKCLEKDRRRRYETANALAADLQRCLAGEAVLAAPPSRLYVARKMLRRYRTAAAIVAAILLTASVGTVTSLLQWHRAESAREAESQQRAQAQAVSEFLRDLLTAADPTHTRGAKVTVREALDAAAARIEAGSLKNQPTVEAAVRSTLGETYVMLGLYRSAEPQLRRAVDLTKQAYGHLHENYANALHALGVFLCRCKWELPEAEPLLREALAIRRKLYSNQDMRVADTLWELSVHLHCANERDQAAPLESEARSIRRELRGDAFTAHGEMRPSGRPYIHRMHRITDGFFENCR